MGAKSHRIVGTAGHIDHGKTTLTLRLTGVDTDRLPEEKRRGITIVLGFAPLVLPDGTQVGLIDVPGHERFVKNMVAGAGGIDVALLVVAADEGVMPQTREHVEICQLLGIRHGLVALTKLDKAGRELAELAAEDVRAELLGTFLAEAPIVPCSAHTGEGIEELRQTLARVLAQAPERRAAETLLLPIDRCFTMHGFGSVVTGTLISGSVAVGQQVEVLPSLPGRPITEPVKVRGLQVFKEKVEQAFAGDRTAVNLQGVELDRLAVGQVLVTPGAAEPTSKVAVRLQYLKSRNKPLKTSARILFHTGTALVEAGVTLIGTDELAPGQTGYAHVLLKEPIATLPGQHFIARGFDPVEKAGRTIAGGLILDPHPGRRRRQAPETLQIMDKLAALAAEGPGEGRREAALLALVRERSYAGLPDTALARRTGTSPATLEKLGRAGPLAKETVTIGTRRVDRGALTALAAEVQQIVGTFHKEHPFKTGIAPLEVATRVGPDVPPEITAAAVDLLVGEKKLERGAEGLRQAGRAAPAAQTDTGAAQQKVLAALREAGMEPPLSTELGPQLGIAANAFKELLASLVRSGHIVHAAPQLYFAKEPFEAAKEKVLAFAEQKGEITTAQAKDLLKLSRKFLIPLLEAFDRFGYTVRIGEARKAKARTR